MDLTYYEIKPSLNPFISDSLQPLIDMLVTEWDLWAIKPETKTLNTISKCKWTLLSLQTCIYENDWKRAYLTMKKEDISVSDLKACFRGKKDEQRRALIIYKNNRMAKIYVNIT